MNDLKRRIDDVATLMSEFGLEEAELSGPDWRVAFKKRRKVVVATTEVAATDHDGEEFSDETPPSPARAGLPVSSPMAGIFYLSANPTAAPFVKEGDQVVAGQVVALIEAMKVFNEITSPISGKVTSIVVAAGQLVQPGEPLMYLE